MVDIIDVKDINMGKVIKNKKPNLVVQEEQYIEFLKKRLDSKNFKKTYQLKSLLKLKQNMIKLN